MLPLRPVVVNPCLPRATARVEFKISARALSVTLQDVPEGGGDVRLEAGEEAYGTPSESSTGVPMLLDHVNLRP